MSEFTAAVLYRPRYAAQVAHAPGIDDFVKEDDELNAHWRYLLLRDPFLVEPPQIEWLFQLSQTVPLLYYYHAEDHGWGYRIFKDGTEVARLDVDYESGQADAGHANARAFCVFEIPEHTIEWITRIDAQLQAPGPKAFPRLVSAREELADALQISDLRWMI